MDDSLGELASLIVECDEVLLSGNFIFLISCHFIFTITITLIHFFVVIGLTSLAVEGMDDDAENIFDVNRYFYI